MAGKETYNSLSHRALTMTKIIIVNRHLFRGGYYAITLFGVVFARRELTAKEINHERIHAAQQPRTALSAVLRLVSRGMAFLSREIPPVDNSLLPCQIREGGLRTRERTALS